MSEATLSLRILAPSQTVLEVEEVRRVRLRLADQAWLSIYPHHAPLIAETIGGTLSYVVGDEQIETSLASGILCVYGDNRVEILTHGRAEQASTDVADDAMEEFDRLARQLMLMLNAEPAGVLSKTRPSDEVAS
jgi:F0F1-type ATP synthase epsilon subunit